MYRIERTDWGFKLTFGGFIQKEEMEAWVADSRLALEETPDSFGVYVDMTELKPLAPDVRTVMVGGQQLYQNAGMVRSSVIVRSKATVLQFRRIAKDSGIYDWERYFEVDDPDHESRGMAWISEGVDPDA